MSKLTYLQRLAISLAFGAAGIYLLARFILQWPADKSNLLALVYVVFLLLLVAFAQLRDLLGAAGATIGYVFMATVAAGVTAFQQGFGQPSREAKDKIKESIVRTAMQAVDQAPDHAPLISVAKLNITLDAIVLNAHEGKPWSRDALVKADITTQPYWNLANYVLKLLGLRQDRSTKLATRGSAEEDLKFIRKNVKVIEDIVLVKEHGRNGWKRVDLNEAHFLI